MNNQLTKCCEAYSTYYDDELVCKVCFENVEVGEGDGVETDSAPVEIDGKYYKEAQHLSVGDQNTFGLPGADIWTVVREAEVHGQAVGVGFRCQCGRHDTYYATWSVGQMINVMAPAS